jgi:aspartyl-tRNA(Asn)/glutamyl-tRNA(Gln) amidotransferase subunit B
MELGGLFKDQAWSSTRVPANELASIIAYLQRKTIASRTAKKLLLMKFEGEERPVEQIIVDDGLALEPLSRPEYIALAQTLLHEKPDMVKDIVDKKQSKKIKWFVGQMMARSPEGSVEPDTAEQILVELLGLAGTKR